MRHIYQNEIICLNLSKAFLATLETHLITFLNTLHLPSN